MGYDAFKAEQQEKLDSIFTALDAEDMNRDEIKESITSVLEAQANYGFDQYKKKQSQVRKFEEVLDAIGYEGESVKDFAEKFKQDKSTIDSNKDENQKLLDRIARLEAEDAERQRPREPKRAWRRSAHGC